MDSGILLFFDKTLLPFYIRFLAVFIIKWKFLKTASRFKTTERSNEMRITPGGKKVKIEQINCVMGTDKRRFPMIYSSVKPSQPSQN